MSLPAPSPTRTLGLVLLSNLIGAAAALWLALATPWLGLGLVGDDRGVVVAAATGPAAQIPVGVVLSLVVAVPGGPALNPVTEDLLEEPDVVADYRQMDAFFQRQDRIAAILAAPAVRLEWPGGTALVTPGERPVSSLPAAFWFQLLVAMAGCLIACWVWVLRPGDWGARMFGITGLTFPIFAMPAAVYSSRELALPGDLFFALSATNHFGAFMFGAALAGIFLCHPRPLLAPRYLAGLFLVYGLWWLNDVLRIAPDLDWGNRFAVMSEMLLAMALAAVQWRKSRGAPLDRAALRWFTLSLLVGSGLFILSTVASASLGWLPPIPQGYAFGFFLLIYIGIALGLRRYRLFDLDEWAYRILLWVGGAALVIGMDAILIAAFHLEPGPSLGITLLLAGWLYFPVRQWLWLHVAHRPRLQLHELMPDVVDIAFKPSPDEREMQWDALLRKLYAPLELRADPGGNEQTRLDEDGLSLRIPARGNLSARALRFADGGSRLFSAKDVAFISALLGLVERAEGSRQAYEQGAEAERRRIARDMHDDVGARLLMLIHRSDTPEMAEIARAAMTDLRTSLCALDVQSIPLADALADWRAEAEQRCEAAGIRLVWSAPEPLPDARLAARRKSALERTLREAVTNALKHAAPSTISISVGLEAGRIELAVADDGAAPTPERWIEGRGLRGMRQRLAEHGGELALAGCPGGGSRISLRLAV